MPLCYDASAVRDKRTELLGVRFVLYIPVTRVCVAVPRRQAEEWRHASASCSRSSSWGIAGKLMAPHAHIVYLDGLGPPLSAFAPSAGSARHR